MVNEFIAAFIMAIVQAITEWVPVSSSGHLVLTSHLLKYNPGISFDLAVHFGTLIAVIIYFLKTIFAIIKDTLNLNFKTQNGKLGLYIIVATIPAAIIGILFRNFFENAFNSLTGVSIGFGITGILLLIGSLNFKRTKKNKEIGFFRAFIIGCFQIISIFPGVSRSGTTISSGILFGLDEKTAMKFAFLISIPIILGASLFGINLNTINPEMCWATIISFVVGLGTIHIIFTKILVKKENLRIFAIYALLLSLIVGIYTLI